MAKWRDTPVVNEASWNAREAKIEDLQAALDMRDAATHALYIALHGELVRGKTIYHLVYDAAVMRQQIKNTSK